MEKQALMQKSVLNKKLEAFMEQKEIYVSKVAEFKAKLAQEQKAEEEASH